MKIKDLQNKMVAVLGFGMEGKATVNYLIKHGIKPVLFDQKPWSEWLPEDQSLINSLKINFIFGPDCFKELAGFDMAFRSPGVKLDNISGYGLQLTSQTKWFFEHCPAKIIGVTGTKGKGTTSSLIYEMLKHCFGYGAREVGQESSQTSNLKPRTFLTGNIGKEQSLDFLDELTKNDWVVYELSSFQLQDLEVSPHIAVVLMTTSEHLDYHKDNQEYIQSKSAISKYQNPEDFCIMNADYDNSIIIGEQGHGKKIYYSRKGVDGADCRAERGEIILENSEFILSVSELQLKGPHNLENFCASILAASSAGCSLEAIKEAAVNFKGLEHRLEFVSEKRGVKFYNDSFSTTPETAIAAISSFEEPEILILGGSTKKSDFSGLASVIIGSKNIKAIILIGQEGKKIELAISKAGGFNNFIFTDAINMEKIIEQVKSVAQPGDVVLLSPACASFGMFKDYKDRGEQFKDAVFLY